MNAPLEKSLLETIKAPHFPIYMDYSATTRSIRAWPTR